MTIKRFTHFLSLLISILVIAGCSNNKPPTNTLPSTEQIPTDTLPTTAQKKPKIALALGGGASKGFAHIGVIKVLKQHNLPIDIITGTSAGSVVGSIYASGMSIKELEAESVRLDKSDLADLTLSSNGFIKGQKLQDYINKTIGHKPMETFPILFAAIATDFSNGKMVIFNRGNAGQAVRASASIPSIFQPTVIKGRKYVDGGLTAPVPVSAALQLGADIVIAVDISDKPKPQSKGGFLDNLNQSINILSIHALNRELDMADIVIKPDVLHLGSVGGFNQRKQAIEAGEAATRKLIPKIKQLIKQQGQ